MDAAVFAASLKQLREDRRAAAERLAAIDDDLNTFWLHAACDAQRSAPPLPPRPPSVPEVSNDDDDVIFVSETSNAVAHQDIAWDMAVASANNDEEDAFVRIAMQESLLEACEAQNTAWKMAVGAVVEPAPRCPFADMALWQLQAGRVEDHATTGERVARLAAVGWCE